MMRMVVGVVVLLLAAFVLLNLGRKQAEALRPAASGASAPGSPENLPGKYKQDFQKAMQQGAGLRASESAP
jgi:hypothetical protein